MAAGLSTLDPEIFGRLTTDERIAIYQFHHHHRKPRFAAQLETPDGNVTLSLVPGKGPTIANVVAPTIPGPASYKAAMTTPAGANGLRPSTLKSLVKLLLAAGTGLFCPRALLFFETSSFSPRSSMQILPLIA
jgi:hypothetical protein